MAHRKVFWLTGLSGAGKTTIGAEFVRRLRTEDVKAELLDGDEVRRELGGDLGYGSEARSLNVRRVAYIADVLARNGIVAVVALTSPSITDRMLARARIEASGSTFIEVRVDCSLEEVERRDTKGLYAKARRGEITGMVGIDLSYEASCSGGTDVYLNTEDSTIDECVRELQDVVA